MNEQFSTLFLESLKDGSYNVGLRDKISSIRISVSEAQESKQRYNIDELLDDKMRENAKKWATAIYHDSTLCSSHGDPYYYPPAPHNREYPITVTNKVIKDNTFVEDEKVIVSTTPVSHKDMDTELAGLDAIDRSILSRTSIEEVDINMITGHTTTSHFRFPIITSCIGYMVHTFLDPKTNNKHLSHIYVYKNQAIIIKLLDFLSDLQVENMEDLRNSREYLKTIHI